MTKTNRRILTGMITGALGMTLVAQEPAAPAAEPEKPAAKPEKPAVDPFKAPDNVAKAPEGAEKTKSGLASLVLKKGTGTEKPKATDTVRVHYTGWKASDGQMFDSSMKRGQPASFPLNRVIAGWTEGLQLMVVGEKRRFWIPSALAYGDQGRVTGDLTFDVELLEIVKAPEPQKAPEPPRDPKAPKDVAAAPEGASKTESGIAFTLLKPGEGKTSPTDTDVAKIHFSGWDAKGVSLGSTKDMEGGKPMAVIFSQSPVAGWAEILKMMKKGESRRVWIPETLTGPAISGRGQLTFDIELVEFEPLPKTPDDVASPPEGAEKTESGLASVVLTKGTGTEKPTAADRVKVHYSGWTASDGKMFDSSANRGEPATFGLGQVIPGWTEGLQLMVVGEKRRFWIPKKIAYNGQPGKPEGNLTFDVELLEIMKAPLPPLPPKDPNAPEDVAAAPEGATKTESGIAYTVLKEGAGDTMPDDKSLVKVHFSAWDSNGSSVASTKNSPEPTPMSVPMDESPIEGWVEILKTMKAGESRRVWIPESLTGPAVTGRGALTFDLELLEFKVKPNAPETPADVAVAPADAKKTPSGLAYKVLKAGEGKRKPIDGDKTKLHFAFWKADGEMVQNSIETDEPLELPVQKGMVVDGWLEGMKLMVEGEKTRFWIPAELAFKGAPGAPEGMIVLDLELLEISNPPQPKKIEAVTPPIEITPPKPKEEKK